MTAIPGATDPLVVGALRRAGVVWVGVDDRAPTAVAPLWTDGDGGPAFVVALDPGRCDVPGLADASECRVIARGSNGARILDATATVEVVPRGGAEWAELIPALLARHLNLADPAEATARWKVIKIRSIMVTTTPDRRGVTPPSVGGRPPVIASAGPVPDHLGGR